MTDTVKSVTAQGFVRETLERREIWRVQTPQGFMFDDILPAHLNAAGQSLPDDAAVAVLLGVVAQPWLDEAPAQVGQRRSVAELLPPCATNAALTHSSFETRPIADCSLARERTLRALASAADETAATAA